MSHNLERTSKSSTSRAGQRNGTGKQWLRAATEADLELNKSHDILLNPRSRIRVTQGPSEQGEARMRRREKSAADEMGTVGQTKDNVDNLKLELDEEESK